MPGLTVSFTLCEMADEQEFAKALGQAIRIARIRRNWSQAELGKAAGLGDPHVSQIERGLRNPALSTLTRIAQALDMTLPQLMAAADEERGRHPKPGRSDLEPDV